VELARPDGTSAEGEVSRLSRLFERNPTSTVFARLADAYLVLGQADRAIVVCRKGLRYRPSYATGHLILGRSCLSAGDIRGAEEEFRKVLQLDPDNPSAHQHLAGIAQRNGDVAAAQPLWKRLERLNPFQPLFQEAETAVVEDQECNEEEPDVLDPEAAAEFPFVSLTLARLYASQGHQSEAERVVRLVSPLDAEKILGDLVEETAK
jgi:tetratricopeptide (TPR) repeat protein